MLKWIPETWSVLSNLYDFWMIAYPDREPEFWDFLSRLSKSDKATIRNDFLRLRAVEDLVDEEASFNEIRKSTGADIRTVKRWFPSYKSPFPRGGGGMAAILRRANHIIDNAELKGTK